MTEPTWTPWLTNPGDCQCPVPEWAVEFKVMLSGNNYTYVNGCWDWSSKPEDAVPITHYCYAVPYDLAWLAENVSVWLASDRDSIRIDWVNAGGSKKSWAYTSSEFCPCQHWHYDQWLRARQDLGYEKQGRICAGETPIWYGPCEAPLSATANPADDPVHHPNHYMLAPELEAIDVIRASLTPTEYMGYLKGSILKYRLRAGRKGEAEQDIAKSDWYRERAVEFEGNQ